MFGRTRVDLERGLAFALLVMATAAAIFWPYIDYDSWWYHFPFSARLWNLGEFGFSRTVEERWRGFPIVWEWVQGLLWAATGSVRCMVIPQLAMAAAYFLVVPRAVEFRRSLLVLGFFACPLLLIHYQSLYLDLPAGLSIALGFFMLLKANEDRHAALAAILFLGLAGNIKTQALLSVFIVSGAVTIANFFSKDWRRRVPRLALIAAAATLLACGSTFWTFYNTGNPLYPFEVKVAGRVVFNGPEDPLVDAKSPQYAVGGRMIGVPQPIAFILSATELDWTLRGVAPRYNISSNSGDDPRNGSKSRTGGWGAIFVLFNLALGAVQLMGIRNEPDPSRKRLLVAATIFTVATATLPRSHELRYWLAVPLVLMPINLRFAASHISRGPLFAALVALLAYGAAQTVATPNSYMVAFRPPVPGMGTFPQRPAAVEKDIKRVGRYCSADEQIFVTSSAITGQPGFVSQRLEDCVTILAHAR